MANDKHQTPQADKEKAKTPTPQGNTKQGSFAQMDQWAEKHK